MSKPLDMSLKDFAAIIISRAYMSEDNQVLQLRQSADKPWGDVVSVQFDISGVSISTAEAGAVLLFTTNKYMFSVSDEHEIEVHNADNKERLCTLRMQAMQNVPILSRGERQKFKAE